MIWTDTDKAQWILENGEPNITWIFERNGDAVYRRPMCNNLPPWISKERTLYGVRNKETNKFTEHT